jgi:hypothetical protein
MSLLDQPRTPDQDSNQGQYYQYSLLGTSIAHPAHGSSIFSQPSPGDLPLQRDDDDTIMHHDYDEGYDPTSDGLDFVPRLIVNFIPEEIHVLATRLATYVSSDSTTAKVTNR